MEQVLLEERDGRVGILTLNRPDTLNALNPALMRAFAEAVARLAEDDAIGCVVVTGAGRGFCSGGDMRASGAANEAAANGSGAAGEEDPEAALERRVAWLRRSSEATRLLHEMGKPTIAMINGACAGAGLSIAGSCDLRFGGTSAKFVSAFTAIGMPGDYGGSWYWTQVLGAGKARQLYLLGEKMGAQEALDFGLVDRVFDDAALRAETLAVAHRLADLPPTGFLYAKQNLNAAAHDSLSAALDRESRNMMLARQALIDARNARQQGGNGK